MLLTRDHTLSSKALNYIASHTSCWPRFPPVGCGHGPLGIKNSCCSLDFTTGFAIGSEPLCNQVLIRHQWAFQALFPPGLSVLLLSTLVPG